MTRKAQAYLFDISKCIEDILDVHLNGIKSLSDFESNKTVRRAVAKELEIIGEAAYRLMQMEVRLSQADSLNKPTKYLDSSIWRL